MKPESRFRLEQRIKELQRDVDRLQYYRVAMMEIFDALVGIDGTGVNRNWLLKQFRRCLK